MAASILFLYMICTQSRQDSETIMARDGMHAPPEVEAKLAELKPDQTGTSRTEKPNQESVPGHGPTFIKAVCTLVQRGSPHWLLKSMRSVCTGQAFPKKCVVSLTRNG